MNRTSRIQIVWIITGGVVTSFSALLGGPEAMLRSGSLALFTLAALALLEQYHCRKWWQYLTAGAISGFLAGLFIYALTTHFFHNSTGKTFHWQMPLSVMMACTTAYGAVMLWCFNAYRHQKPLTRWIRLFVAVGVVNYVAFIPVFLLEPLLFLFGLAVIGTAAIFTFPWVLFALTITNTDEDVPGMAIKWLPVFLLLLFLLIYPTAIFYAETSDHWLRVYNCNHDLKKQLTGYILTNYKALDLFTGQSDKFETDTIIPPMKDSEKEKLAAKLKYPLQWQTISGYALSPDNQYIAIAFKSRWTLNPARYILIIYPSDSPGANGLYYGRISSPNIIWLTEKPEPENEEKIK